MGQGQEDGYQEIFKEAEDDHSSETILENQDNDSGNAGETDSGKTPVITKEFAEKHGLSNTLIGKPMDELANAYKNMQSFDSKLSQQVTALTKKIGQLEGKLSDKEVNKAVEEAEEKLPDYETELSKYIDDDGYVVDKKGLAKFQKDYFELREKLLKKELTKAAADSPSEKTAREYQAEKYQAQMYDALSEGLSEVYEEVKPELIKKVINDFGEYLRTEDEETQSELTRLYSGKPLKLAKDILTHHKANKPSKSKEEEAVEKAHNKQVQKLKDSEKKFTKVSTSERSREKVNSDPIYDELLSEAEEDALNYTGGFAQKD